MTLRVDLIFLPGAETSGFKSKSILGPQDVDPAGTVSYTHLDVYKRQIQATATEFL